MIRGGSHDHSNKHNDMIDISPGELTQHTRNSNLIKAGIPIYQPIIPEAAPPPARGNSRIRKQIKRKAAPPSIDRCIPINGFPPTSIPPPPYHPPTIPAPLTPTVNPLPYNLGGTVMTGPLNVYYVFYGNWTTLDPDTIHLVIDYTSNLGGSYAWGPLQTYYQQVPPLAPREYISPVLRYGGAVLDKSYSYGKLLSDTSVYYIVRNAIAAGVLPPNNSSNIYMVLTAPDVDVASGLCTNYCGWHTYHTFNGNLVIYGLVGSPIRCVSCQSFVPGPNNNTNADSMMSVLHHELAEAASDPLFNAWVDDKELEIADRCSWDYGLTWTTENDGNANVKIGTKEYLLQTLWVNKSGGYCVNVWYEDG